MADKHKTKAEILQELESIKGLLLEEDDIPILQETEPYEWHPEPISKEASIQKEAPPQEQPLQQEPPQVSLPDEEPVYRQHESVLPGQGSLFDEAPANQTPSIPDSTPSSSSAFSQTAASHLSSTQEQKKPGFAANLPPLHSAPKPSSAPRSLAKASGENPFLPQHIRERLHGNNPPPLFEYETAKKIVSATKHIAHKVNKPRQHLVDEVIHAVMPQIESELRQRLFAMSVEELEKLLNEDEDL